MWAPLRNVFEIKPCLCLRVMAICKDVILLICAQAIWLVIQKSGRAQQSRSAGLGALFDSRFQPMPEQNW